VGKNLVGAFHQPLLVWCDTDTLSTLPDEILADGCAEVIKYGYINDPTLLKLLEKDFSTAPGRVIARCIDDKRQLVEMDERDTGARQLLNLGHTVGHAVELCPDFTVSHGSAVAIGMLLVTKAAIANGLCDKEVLPHMQALLRAYRLPTECPFDVPLLAKAAAGDKKRAGDWITLVIPTSLGKSILFPLPITELAPFLTRGAEEF
jgi:3-dehydroquinate synthase